MFCFVDFLTNRSIRVSKGRSVLVNRTVKKLEINDIKNYELVQINFRKKNRESNIIECVRSTRFLTKALFESRKESIIKVKENAWEV